MLKFSVSLLFFLIAVSEQLQSVENISIKPGDSLHRTARNEKYADSVVGKYVEPCSNGLPENKNLALPYISENSPYVKHDYDHLNHQNIPESNSYLHHDLHLYTSAPNSKPPTFNYEHNLERNYPSKLHQHISDSDSSKHHLNYQNPSTGEPQLKDTDLKQKFFATNSKFEQDGLNQVQSKNEPHLNDHYDYLNQLPLASNPHLTNNHKHFEVNPYSKPDYLNHQRTYATDPHLRVDSYPNSVHDLTLGQLRTDTSNEPFTKSDDSHRFLHQTPVIEQRVTHEPKVSATFSGYSPEGEERQHQNKKYDNDEHKRSQNLPQYILKHYQDVPPQSVSHAIITPVKKLDSYNTKAVVIPNVDCDENNKAETTDNFLSDSRRSMSNLQIGENQPIEADNISFKDNQEKVSKQSLSIDEPTDRYGLQQDSPDPMYHLMDPTRGKDIAPLSNRRALMMGSTKVCYACSTLNDASCWLPDRSTSLKYCRPGNDACVTKTYKNNASPTGLIVIRDCSSACHVQTPGFDTNYDSCAICKDDLCNRLPVNNGAFTISQFNVMSIVAIFRIIKYVF